MDVTLSSTTSPFLAVIVLEIFNLPSCSSSTAVITTVYSVGSGVIPLFLLLVSFMIYVHVPSSLKVSFPKSTIPPAVLDTVFFSSFSSTAFGLFSSGVMLNVNCPSLSSNSFPVESTNFLTPVIVVDPATAYVFVKTISFVSSVFVTSSSPSWSLSDTWILIVLVTSGSFSTPSISPLSEIVYSKSFSSAPFRSASVYLNVPKSMAAVLPSLGSIVTLLISLPLESTGSGLPPIVNVHLSPSWKSRFSSTFVPLIGISPAAS